MSPKLAFVVNRLRPFLISLLFAYLYFGVERPFGGIWASADEMIALAFLIVVLASLFAARREIAGLAPLRAPAGAARN